MKRIAPEPQPLALPSRASSIIASLALVALCGGLGMSSGCTSHSPQASVSIERVAVSPDGRGFVLHPSGQPFVPWGFNYDHDHSGRLIEDYWETEWPVVVQDFKEMKELGANVVRVHLQFGRLMRGEEEPDTNSLARFAQLLRLAEQSDLRLDVTGLGCYHKKDVPAWYDALTEERRWSAQANFWRAIARVARNSPALFCYDLMNEPVAPHQAGRPAEWLGPPFGGKHFVQWISREGRGRDRADVATAWIRQLVAAIRQEDQAGLVTVGLVDWSLPRPGLDSGFHPEAIAPDLDFLCVHLYPESGQVGKALETLAAFQVGKPVVIEETFPLKCSTAELSSFIQQSRQHASGWIGFYWGRAPEELRGSNALADVLLLQWLEFFKAGVP